ncbi:MAG: copper chaperone PCu(A)C [Burkholderiaceae bacterium]|nr:MAG: copper chaperone PCu(A)C [Burkholderiaceae bacterium]
MKLVHQLQIPAHGEVDISPGNYHLMLMHAKHPISSDNTVSVVSQFAQGTPVYAPLEVDPPDQVNR